MNKIRQSNNEIKSEQTLTLTQCADVMQNLLDMVNDEKYKPLIEFLGMIGGEKKCQT